MSGDRRDDPATHTLDRLFLSSFKTRRISKYMTSHLYSSEDESFDCETIAARGCTADRRHHIMRMERRPVLGVKS